MTGTDADRPAEGLLAGDWRLQVKAFEKALAIHLDVIATYPGSLCAALSKERVGIIRNLLQRLKGIRLRRISLIIALALGVVAFLLFQFGKVVRRYRRVAG